MAPQVPVDAVTFDAGQTLVELDTILLAERLAERGSAVPVAALDAAAPVAWRQFDAQAATGFGGHSGGWRGLMLGLLGEAGVPGDHEALVDWLWSEQPRRNLWRRPIAGMRAVLDDLRRAGVRVGLISNSEGRIAALFDEIGWTGVFDCVADSGVLHIDKPDRRIFAWTLDQLGVDAARAVHVGDSWVADIEGARAFGMRAIWFGSRAVPVADQDVAACADAGAVRAALSGWGCALG